MFILVDLIMLAVFLVVLGVVAAEKYWGAFWVTVIGGGVIAYFSRESLPALSEISISTWLFGVVGYIAIGYVYSMIKWAFYVKKAVNVINNISPNKTAAEKIDRIVNDYNFRHKFEAIKVSLVDDKIVIDRSGEFSTTITAWAIWWPFIAIQMLFQDIISNIYEYLTEALGKIYQAILNSLASELK